MGAGRLLASALILFATSAAQAQALLEAADVRVTVGPPPLPGRLQIFEATATSHVPRDRLEAVLADPKGWAAALPSFRSIELHGRTGQAEHAHLSFAGAAPPVAISVTRAGRPSRPDVDWTSVLWSVEEGTRAPVYVKGEWYLTQNPGGGTRIRLTIVIDPRHWPDSRHLFSAERLKSSLVQLERSASTLAR